MAERQTHNSRSPVAIVGAGLTGMSAAYQLQQQGIAHRLFERRDRPGGLAVTTEERGYRFDRTGHLLHLQQPDIRQLAIDWIGSAYRSDRRKSAIWSHGVYTRYPFQANLYGLPPKVAYECLLGFIEARQAAEAGAPDNFAQYCLATFGKGISDHFMVPYNSRLWGVAPDEITADWCRRFVPVPTLEDVIAGAVGLPDRQLGYNAEFIYPNRGIEQLSAGLATCLQGIELGQEVKAIHSDERRLQLDGEQLSYDVLISTAPLPRLVDMVLDAPEQVRAAAKQLRCTHLYYLDVALARGCGKPYHWVYVPEPSYPFYRVGCYSNISSQMAPPGKANLYVELVDRQQPGLSQLLPKVARGLTQMGLIAGPHAIVFARLRRIDYAYVVFDHNYYAALDVIQPFLRARNILSTGRYGGWNYSSMGDAISFGQQTAQQAATLLDVQ